MNTSFSSMPPTIASARRDGGPLEKQPAAVFRTSATLPPAKGATFASYAVP
jgi:hypothetical protein